MIRRQLSDWLRWIETLHPRSIDLQLERVQAMLARLQLDRPPFAVVTIGGTNGKGSTAAMCEAILRAAGYRTGLYTSPHLIRYNERVRVDGRMAADDELCAAFERIEANRDGISLTYFEYGTVAALDIFRNHSVEIAVLEVGMGGRLDAVNAVDPDVAVITSIGLDHTSWLGPDRASIAREKAGIFRPGRPAVCGDLDPPVTLIETAERLGAHLYRCGVEFRATPSGVGWSYHFGERVRSGLPHPALRGDYQLRNAACALTALDLLGERFPVSQAHIREGLLDAVVAGRFQLIPGTPPTILDVAHNVQAAQALAANLKQHRVPGRTHAVFGMLLDKPIAEVAGVLADQIDCWYVASLGGERGASAAHTAARLREASVTGTIGEFAGVVPAYEAARASAKPHDRLLVFGSFYTVGDILAHLNAGPA